MVCFPLFSAFSPTQAVFDVDKAAGELVLVEKEKNTSVEQIKQLTGTTFKIAPTLKDIQYAQ